MGRLCGCQAVCGWSLNGRCRVIVETLFRIVLGLVSWIASIIPDFGLNLELNLAGALAQLASALAAVNGWVPMNTLLLSVVMLFIVQIVVSLWGFIVWIYHQFWGSS